MTRPFIAGDVVRHEPTGEKWLLIVDEHEGRVVPGGWPDTRAEAKDCVLLKASNSRYETLKATSKSGHSAHSLAALQLEKFEQDGGAA